MLFIDIVFCISICYNGCVARSIWSGPCVSQPGNSCVVLGLTDPEQGMNKVHVG